MNTTPSDTKARFRAFLKECDVEELEAMNLLQEYGIVSDDAVGIDDCADSDLEYALKYVYWLC